MTGTIDAALCRALRVACALLFTLACGHAAAHGGSGAAGMATITISASSVRYSLTLSDIAPGPLADAMRLGQPGVAPDYAPLLAAIERGIRISAEATVCAPARRQLVPPSAATPSITGSVDFDCAPAAGRLAIRDDLPDLLGADHHTLALVVWPGGSGQYTFDAGAREAVWSAAGGIRAAGKPGEFFLLGMNHVFLSLGQMLLLLALILRADSWKNRAAILAALTAAQVATMAVAVDGGMAVAPRLTEAAFAAAAIVFATGTLFPRHALPHGWALGLAVGLIHGLGLPESALSLGFTHQSEATALLGFNLGTLAGQIGVVLLGWPVLRVLRRHFHEPRLGATLAAALILSGIVLLATCALPPAPAA